MQYRGGLPKPSFQQGFARSATESSYPNLWTGLLGIWSPSLGIQGLTTLRDFSGRQRHATISGTFTGSSWVTSPYGYAANFNTQSYALVSSTESHLATLTRCSLAAWVKKDVSGLFNGNGPVIWGERSASTPIWKLQGSDGGASWRFVHRDDAGTLTNIIGNVAINDGFWHLVGLTKNGTAMTFYVDGKIDRTATLGGNDTLTVTDVRIGDEGFDPANTQWQDAMGDVTTWNRVLSPNEMMTLYLGASPLQPKPLSLGKAAAVVGGFTSRLGLLGVG